MKKETKDSILFWIVTISFIVLILAIAYFLVQIGWIDDTPTNITANMVGDMFG